MTATATGHDHTTSTFILDDLVVVVAETLGEEEVTRGHVDLFAVDADEMAAMNVEHMGKEGPTDVLAFPLDDDDGLKLDLPGVEPHLGDLVVCPEVARAQASSHAGTEEAELCLLVIHGVLHLLGHDHAEPEETLVMQQRERFHLARYGFAHPEPAPTATP